MPFFSSVSSVVNGASITPDVVVGDEAELLDTISRAPNKKSYVIGLSETIVLKSSLEIPKNKNIILVMVGSASSRSVALVGGEGMDTIIVKSGGKLELGADIVVTHAEGDTGRGVYVERKGTLILSGGTISGNTIDHHGGGVYNCGTFKMFDGEISDNTAYDWGGGVYTASIATFVMFGGEITRNTARYGGGVHYFEGSVSGTFTMSGGTISGNIAHAGPHPDLAVVAVDSFPVFTVIHYLLFITVAIAVVGLLLFYLSRKRKQLSVTALVNSAVV